MSGIGSRITHFLKKRKRERESAVAVVVVKDGHLLEDMDMIEPPPPPPKDEVVVVPKTKKEDYGYVMDSLKKGKWAEPRELLSVRDPAERVRLRMEMQEQKEEETRTMVKKEEEERERVWRRTKELLMRREEREAEEWQAKIREKAVQDAAERRRKEALEKAEDEQQARDKAEKRTAERQRRAEAREAWNKKQSQVSSSQVTVTTTIPQSAAVAAAAESTTVPVWATIQTQHNGVWKRRYCVFAENTLRLYRAIQDSTPVLEVHGTVTALREPEEELGAMPHSFVVEFTDRRPWAIYTDSGDEKLRLLALLQRCRE